MKMPSKPGAYPDIFLVAHEAAAKHTPDDDMEGCEVLTVVSASIRGKASATVEVISLDEDEETSAAEPTGQPSGVQHASPASGSPAASFQPSPGSMEAFSALAAADKAAVAEAMGFEQLAAQPNHSLQSALFERLEARADNAQMSVKTLRQELAQRGLQPLDRQLLDSQQMAQFAQASHLQHGGGMLGPVPQASPQYLAQMQQSVARAEAASPPLESTLVTMAPAPSDSSSLTGHGSEASPIVL